MRKRIIKLLLVFSFVVLGLGAMSQTQPPTLPGGHGLPVDQGGGGAPIGGGVFILLGLGAAYAGKKLYDSKKKKLLD